MTFIGVRGLGVSRDRLCAFAALRAPIMESEIARKAAKPQREEKLSVFAPLRAPIMESEIARKAAKPQREEKLSVFAPLRELFRAPQKNRDPRLRRAGWATHQPLVTT